MEVCALSGHETSLSEDGGLFISRHVQGKGPLEAIVDGPPLREIVDEVIECSGSFTRFDAVFEDAALVETAQGLHFLGGGAWMHAALVEGDEEIVEDVLKIHPTNYYEE